MKTWRKEALFVACVLASVTYFSGNKPLEWIGTFTVLVTFMHAQIGFRLAEAAEKNINDPHRVECYWKMERYFMLKEVGWFTYFSLHGAWTGLVGVGVFLAYPFWRRYHLAQKANRVTNLA